MQFVRFNLVAGSNSLGQGQIWPRLRSNLSVGASLDHGAIHERGHETVQTGVFAGWCRKTSVAKASVYGCSGRKDRMNVRRRYPKKAHERRVTDSAGPGGASCKGLAIYDRRGTRLERCKSGQLAAATCERYPRLEGNTPKGKCWTMCVAIVEKSMVRHGQLANRSPCLAAA